MNQRIIQAALAAADNLEQRAKAIRAEVATITKQDVTANTINDLVKKIKKDRGGKRDLSPEARQRIVTAQKKRWAKFRKEDK